MLAASRRGFQAAWFPDHLSATVSLRRERDSACRVTSSPRLLSTSRFHGQMLERSQSSSVCNGRVSGQPEIEGVSRCVEFFQSSPSPRRRRSQRPLWHSRTIGIPLPPLNWAPALWPAPLPGWAPTTVGGAPPAAVLPTTAAGAAAFGGVAGIGTVAVIDAAVQPCRGFQALFGLNKDECVNGAWVGPQRYSEVPRRRIVR
jgi:hypothetical protein